MPIIKRFDENFDFKVEVAETDDDYGQEIYVFLAHNIMVEENYATDYDTETYELQATNYYPIIENPIMGLCAWDRDDSCWKPVEEVVQKAYSDMVAERVLLNNPPPKKKK